MALLDITNLEVCFCLSDVEVTALHAIALSIESGERVGVVGESGAGKSLLGFAILRLISKPGYIRQGQVLFSGHDLCHFSSEQLRQVRGNRVAMIFQDPMVTLNPVLTIETQMVECLRAHQNISRQQAINIALEKLNMVQIPSPQERLKQYPHELSGGMRQRIVIAIALLLDPELIIADEPTTALDVTIQAEIMQLLHDLCEEQKTTLMLITHDLGVVAQMTHRTVVMYAGRIIEMGATKTLISQPQHPYTQGLIQALPQSKSSGKRLNQIQGQMPSIESLPTGCAFHPRCKHVQSICKKERPILRGDNHYAIACHM